jgi:hypothetical protein
MPEIVVIETDPVVEFVVTDSPGGGISVPDLYGNDTTTVAAVGEQTIVLTHTPVPESVVVFWRGLRLYPSRWTLSWRNLVIPDAEHRAEVGDTFTVYYRWREIDQGAIPNITVDVMLTRGRLLRHEADGSGTDVFINLPADGPVSFELNALDSTDNDQGTYLYPVEYDGLDATGTAFIPPTPAGYELVDIRPFVKAHMLGGAQDTITADTSGWGYHPAPTLSPFLQVFGSPDYLTFGALPATTDPAEPIACAAASTTEGYQDPLTIQKWYSPVPPPWLTDPRTIRVSEYGWRCFYAPIGGV